MLYYISLLYVFRSPLDRYIYAYPFTTYIFSLYTHSHPFLRIHCDSMCDARKVVKYFNHLKNVSLHLILHLIRLKLYI